LQPIIDFRLLNSIINNSINYYSKPSKKNSYKSSNTNLIYSFVSNKIFLKSHPKTIKNNKKFKILKNNFIINHLKFFFLKKINKFTLICLDKVLNIFSED
jgi:hypothetical protein